MNIDQCYVREEKPSNEVSAAIVWQKVERYSARASNAFQFNAVDFIGNSVVTDLIVSKFTFLNTSSRVEI
jgi:hypothetical protein